jgi:3-keto-disaccharide hydrolase
MKISMIALSLALLSTGVLAQQTKSTWTFDNDKPGQIAGGFSNETGDWKVVADAGAPSKPNVLAQTARSSASTFNLALLKDLQFKDMDVLVQMRSVAGKSDQGGGLVWRARDAKNYYVVRYNPLEDNLRLYRVVKGTRSAPLQDITIRHADGWHELRVIMSGDRIECYYDGKKYLDFRDANFKEAGKIGLWTKADAQTQFDDLTVSGK